MQSINFIAQGGYHAYSKAGGHVTFDGKPMPVWQALSGDRQACWSAAASCIAGLRGIVNSTEFLAAEAWDAYSKAAKGLAANGATLPTWDELPIDRQDAWQAAATHILAELSVLH